MLENMLYDYLIVGSGLYGAVMARELTDAGKKCLVIDKRSHIGGNVYTENVHGIDVHKYGAHIFHTSDRKIWDYVNRFAEFNHYVNKPKVSYKGKIYSFPINLMTLYQIYGTKTPKEAEEKLSQVRVKNDYPKNLEEWILSQVGVELYEIFIKGYTMKQWLKDPKELPSSIIKRLPIRLNYEENYFEDKYQGIPVDGYTKLVERILENIEVRIGVDFFQDRSYFNQIANKIIYTGKIDEYYDFEFGELEYRTLRFEDKILDGNYQGNAVFNFTDYEVPYTRVYEHKHFNFGNQPKTVVTWEYPEPWDKSKVPYYPVINEENNKMYNKYKSKAENNDKVIFGGRLGEFKYYDMHQVIGAALSRARKELA